MSITKSRARRIAGIAVLSAAAAAPVAQADLVNVDANVDAGIAQVAITPSGTTAQVGSSVAVATGTASGTTVDALGIAVQAGNGTVGLDAGDVRVGAGDGITVGADVSDEVGTTQRAADTSQERAAARRTVVRANLRGRRVARRVVRRACGSRVLRSSRSCRVAKRIVR